MLYRFSLDLAIPKAVYDSIPVENRNEAENLIDFLRQGDDFLSGRITYSVDFIK